MFHYFQDLFAFQFLNWSGNDSSLTVNTTKKFHCSLRFGFVNNICTAHDDSSGIFYLVIKEFAKVSHVHFAFLCIYNSSIAVENKPCFFLYSLYSFDYVRKFADT